MTNRRDRLVGIGHFLYEFLRRFVNPQMIGIHDAAGNDHRVIFAGVELVDRHVDHHLLAHLDMPQSLDSVIMRCRHDDVRT